MMTSEFIQIARNATYFLLAQGTARIVGFLYILFLARALPIADFGYLTLALAILVIADTAADLGLSRLTLRDLSQEGAKTPRYLGTLIPLRIMTSLAAYVIVLIYVGIAGYPSIMITLTVIAGVGLLFTGPSMLTEAALQSHQKFALISIAHMALSLLQASSGVAILLLGGGAVEIAMTFAFTNLTYLIIVLAGVRRLHFAIKPQIDAAFWRECLRSSLPYGAMAIIFVLSLRIELLMLGWLGNATDLGTYAVAARFLEAALLIPIILATVLAPNFSRHQLEPEKGANLYFLSLRAAVLLAIPAALIAAIIARPIIDFVLPDKYEGAGELLQLALIGFPFAVAFYLNLSLMFATRRQGRTLVMTIGLVVTQLGINATMVPLYGAYGAALSFCAAAILSGLVSTVSVGIWFEHGGRVIWAVTPPIIGGAIMLALVFMAFDSLSMWGAIVGLSAYAAVAGLLLVLLPLQRPRNLA